MVGLFSKLNTQLGEVSPEQYFQFAAGVLGNRNLGQGIQAGLLGANQARMQIEDRKRKEQLKAAIADTSLPVELRNLLQALPPDQAGAALAQYMMQKPTAQRPISVGPGSVLLNPEGTDVLFRNPASSVSGGVKGSRLMTQDELKANGLPLDAAVEVQTIDGRVVDYEMLHSGKGDGAARSDKWEVMSPTEVRDLNLDPNTKYLKKVNADGTVIDYKELTKAPTPQKLSEREIKIREAMHQFGVSREKAVKYVDKFITFETDPIDGSMWEVDIVTKKRTPFQTSVTDPLPILNNEAAEGSADLFTAAPDTFGLAPRTKEFFANTLGQAFPGIVNPKTLQGSQLARRLQQKLVMAYAISNRPPVMEQSRIVKMAPNPNSIFQSAMAANVTMGQMHTELTQDANAMAQIWNNPRAPQKLRVEARERHSQIMEALRIIGDPPPDYQPRFISGDQAVRARGNDLSDEEIIRLLNLQ